MKPGPVPDPKRPGSGLAGSYGPVQTFRAPSNKHKKSLVVKLYLGNSREDAESYDVARGGYRYASGRNGRWRVLEEPQRH